MALSLVTVATVGLPGAGAGVSQAVAAQETVSITPLVRWTSGRASCPSGEKNLETKQVPIPAPGTSVSESWIGDYPSCASPGWSFNPSPALPINVTYTNKITGANGEPGICTRMGDLCQYKHTITLTAAKGCECKTLRIGVRGGMNIGDPDLQGRTHLRATLRWVMVCTKGPFECKGDVQLALPARFTALTPPLAKVSCKGRCNVGGPSTFAGDVKMHLVAKGYGAASRAGKTLTLVARTYCNEGASRNQVGTARIVVVFDRRGLVDTRRSDLNADGKPDKR